MKLLEGKTALITGASRGIGKAIALKFASEGCQVAFTDLFEDENMRATEEELKAFGVQAKGYASNAARFEETETTVSAIANDFGRIDILVNNAGITKDTLLMRMTEEQWDAVISVNLKSVFNFTKAVQRFMLKQRSGSIINMSSVVGVSGNAGQANYSASKAGIIGFTKSVARELGSRGIPGVYHHGNDGENSRRRPESLGRDHPDETGRYPRRGGRSGSVPRVRPLLIRERSGYPGVRRYENMKPSQLIQDETINPNL